MKLEERVEGASGGMNLKVTARHDVTEYRDWQGLGGHGLSVGQEFVTCYPNTIGLFNLR